MFLRSASLMIAVLAGVFSGGCRLVDVARLSDAPPLSRDVLTALRSELKRDQWQLRTDETLVAIKNSGPSAIVIPANRWQFRRPVVGQVITRLDAVKKVQRANDDERVSKSNVRKHADGKETNRTEPKKISDADDWDGLGTDAAATLRDHPDVSDSQSPIPTVGSSGSRYLAALVAEDGLTGWNAAILWAQRDPTAAREVAAILGKLVTSPPHYDPLTGRSISPSKSVPAEFPPKRNPSAVPLRPKESGKESTADLALNELLEVIRERVRKETARSEQRESLSMWTRFRRRLAGPQNRPQTLRISSSMQSAAAEAWCRVLAAGSRNREIALRPAGQFLLRARIPNAVRVELFRGIGRWIPPDRIPRLGNAMPESDRVAHVPVTLRRAAIASCLSHALQRRAEQRSGKRLVNNVNSTHNRNDVNNINDVNINNGNNGNGETNGSGGDMGLWPESVMNCRLDPDSQVRRTFGLWVAAAGHPRALFLLNRQFLDVDPRVRLTSLIGLGMLGSEPARRKLRDHAKHEKAGIRAAAVRGLAHWGSDELSRYSRDKSAAVRTAVAESLADFPSPQAALTMRRLLSRSSSQVQQICVDSIAGWPDRLAIPLLLHGMGFGTPKTARLAYRGLRSRVPEVHTFAFTERQPVRERAARELSRRHHLPIELLKTVFEDRRAAPANADPQYVAEIKTQLKTLADSRPSDPLFFVSLEWLKRLPEKDVPLLEQLILESERVYPDDLYDKVLAAKTPAYAALRELNQRDPLQQRRGAQTLARIGSEQSLSPLIVRQMLKRLRSRLDRVLWRDAMTAVMDHTHEASEQLAVEAASHPVPAIRILASQYFRRHPHPRNGYTILQLMNDADDRNVRLAAVKAAGFCRSDWVVRGGKPADLKPSGGRSLPSKSARSLIGLEGLIVSSDPGLRHAAVLSLSRLDQEFGFRELSRMSYDSSVSVREEAFRLMGETGKRRFVAVLVRRGWTERHPAVQRVILQSLEQITPVAERPVGLSRVSGYHEKIKLWATALAVSRKASGGRVRLLNRQSENRETGGPVP